ncbi:MAG TPA: hypothetical protein VI959_02765 [Alphaproteobacteria bacterium]|nr:hypothetical protein [Alphaproteobacteria bacterium]
MSRILLLAGVAFVFSNVGAQAGLKDYMKKVEESSVTSTIEKLKAKEIVDHEITLTAEILPGAVGVGVAGAGVDYQKKSNKHIGTPPGNMNPTPKELGIYFKNTSGGSYTAAASNIYEFGTFFSKNPNWVQIAKDAIAKLGGTVGTDTLEVSANNAVIEYNKLNTEKTDLETIITNSHKELGVDTGAGKLTADIASLKGIKGSVKENIDDLDAQIMSLTKDKKDLGDIITKAETLVGPLNNLEALRKQYDPAEAKDITTILADLKIDVTNAGGQALKDAQNDLIQEKNKLRDLENFIINFTPTVNADTSFKKVEEYITYLKDEKKKHEDFLKNFGKIYKTMKTGLNLLDANDQAVRDFYNDLANKSYQDMMTAKDTFKKK